MGEIALKHDICSVDCGVNKTYGGSQMLSDSKNIRKCGCGIVAAADLLIYIDRQHAKLNYPLLRELPADGAVPLDTYRRLLKELNRRFFPLIPTKGINGFMLVGGLNVFLRLYGAKMTALWCLSGGKLWQRVEDMLSRDLPVIFSVGPNFPKIWGKERLRLYAKNPEGVFRPAGSVHAHFMTVTAMDDTHICVSSWGRKYYIFKSEFEEYVRKYSGSIICNMVNIR